MKEGRCIAPLLPPDSYYQAVAKHSLHNVISATSLNDIKCIICPTIRIKLKGQKSIGMTTDQAIYTGREGLNVVVWHQVHLCRYFVSSPPLQHPEETHTHTETPFSQKGKGKNPFLAPIIYKKGFLNLVDTTK